MDISSFSFDLPSELIAQHPASRRDGARMLLVERAAGTFRDGDFRAILDVLSPNDVLVLNNTRVFPARLMGRTSTGAAIELFLLESDSDGHWTALSRPARRINVGKRLEFGTDLHAEVLEKLSDGQVLVRFDTAGDFYEQLEAVGRTPLPPYIRREQAAADDRERYQTVYAKERGAVAAPTAGLHFTAEILDAVRSRGVTVVEITLHVGYGTFEPVRVADLAEHRVSPERCRIDEAAAEVLESARRDRRRIVAVGTTTTRALESALLRNGHFRPGQLSADVTITPGYRFAAIGALLTNFHLPQSSLLVLTSVFGGHELIMRAYRHAVAEKYRFYSYGDCMFIQ